MIMRNFVEKEIIFRARKVTLAVKLIQSVDLGSSMEEGAFVVTVFYTGTNTNNKCRILIPLLLEIYS